MKARHWQSRKTDRILIDSFEVAIPRVAKHAQQKRLHSSKKKRDTLKTLVVTDETREALDVDAGHRSTAADKKIYEAGGVKEQFPRARKQALLAYLGTEGVETPDRKLRGGQLTEASAKRIGNLATVRVHVEHGSPSQRVQDRARGSTVIRLASSRWSLGSPILTAPSSKEEATGRLVPTSPWAEKD
jgi:hypothetical protein